MSPIDQIQKQISGKEFNLCESELFRNLFSNNSESFQTNPKNVSYLVWCKSVQNHTDSFQFNRSSGWFGLTEFKKWFGLIRIEPDWLSTNFHRIRFKFRQGTYSIGFNGLHWLKPIKRIRFNDISEVNKAQSDSIN